jgi:hypothetical protein
MLMVSKNGVLAIALQRRGSFWITFSFQIKPIAITKKVQGLPLAADATTFRPKALGR